MFDEEFKTFRKMVATRFEQLSKQELYNVGSGDELWDVYLSSFPEGTNPVYRVRTYHDCTADRQFVKNIGRVVAINNSDYETVWDVENIPYPYNVVAKAMADWLRTQEIQSIFRTKENKYGTITSRAVLDGNVVTFNHFEGKVDTKHKTYSVGEAQGKVNNAIGVFKRGLEEIKDSAIATVLDLINDNSLYRGAEFKKIVADFRDLKKDYLKTNRRDLFVWKNVQHSAALIKNTVIGTLLVDLSSGVDLERAVSSFESKVAPINYKRPKALITQRMIDEALKQLKESNLETALNRRFAKISDVSVNDILWVDNKVAPLMKDSLKDLLMTEVKPKAPSLDKAIQISIDDFMSNVLKETSSMEVFVSNGHQGNFVSLTAPVDENVEPLFKWDNNFAWSYDGNITDSIKEKVKRAGGNVNAKFRVSLSWENLDDLDIHGFMPNGNRVYFGNKMGILDVDMNVSNPKRGAVENLSWTSVQNGVYKIQVDNYNPRETSNQGFTLEVEMNGKIWQFSSDKSPKRHMDCLQITISNGELKDIKVLNGLKGSSLSQDKWGIKTETFVEVQTVMLSPNFWGDNAVGNKHWIFVLKDCVNPEPTRGIYNEFLNSKLDKHRKVLEILGEKTKCPVTNEQLSGLGFSSTKKDTIVVKANNKLYNVTF